MYISENYNWTPYGYDASLDEELDRCIDTNNDDEIIAFLTYYNNYGLDKVFNNLMDIKYNNNIKQYIAKQGYGLDKFVNDEDIWVREEVAKYGYGLDILIHDEFEDVRQAVAKHGYGLDKLINDEDKDVRVAVSQYLKENGYKSLGAWTKSNPDKVYGNTNFEITNTIKNFVYKIDDSNTLKVESSCNSYEDFFDNNSKESFESNESIIILAVDTKVPLIKVEKALKDEKQVYKFIADITNEDDDSFNVRSIISSKEKFKQLLESVINELNEYPQFNKYTDDLENCI